MGYFPLTGMSEQVRQQLVDDHFLFVSCDRNLIAAGMERDWPEGRGIFHNTDKTFLTWVNEEDQLRIISMQSGGDVRAVFDPGQECLVRVVENPPTLWPVSLHTSSDQITIAGDEEEVIIHELLSDLLTHASEGEVAH